MPLSSLHTIELQLICHMLDCRSIADFARCSPSFLAAASSDFAFRFVEPLELCSLQLPSAPSRATSLLRFIPLRLIWVSPSLNEAVPDRQADRADVDRVCSCPRLVGIDARSRQLNWPAVLSNSCFRGLHELRLGQSAYGGDLAVAVSAMQQLRILSLEKRDRIDFGPLFSVLADLPQLTDLTLSWPPEDHPHGCLLTELDAQDLRGCVRLQRLTLKHVTSDALVWILHSGMTELAEVAVIGFSLSFRLEADPDACAQALNSLPALSKLALLAAQDLDLTLDSLRRALDPAGPLRTLSVQPTPDQNGDLSSWGIIAVLETHPLLERLCLELWSVVEVSPSANGEDAVGQTQVRDEAFQCTWIGAQQYDLRRMRQVYEEIADQIAVDEGTAGLAPEEDPKPRLCIIEDANPKPHPHRVAEDMRARFLKPVSVHSLTKKQTR